MTDNSRQPGEQDNHMGHIDCLGYEDDSCPLGGINNTDEYACPGPQLAIGIGSAGVFIANLPDIPAFQDTPGEISRRY